MQYGEDADYGLSSTGKDVEEEYVDDASTSTRQHETLYCFCHQKATEDMICCDDENCPYKWFHYKCVGIDPSCITDGRGTVHYVKKNIRIHLVFITYQRIMELITESHFDLHITFLKEAR